jgi:hypothetical protein
MGRTPSTFKKERFTVSVSPDIEIECQEHIGPDKQFNSMSELVEDSLRLMCYIIDCKGSSNGEMTKVMERHFTEFVKEKGPGVVGDMATIFLGMQFKEDMEKRATDALAAQASRAPPTTQTPFVPQPLSPQLTPVVHTTVARTPEQAKMEKADEIRKSFPYMLIIVAREKDPLARAGPEKKLLADLERLWLYTGEPTRDDFLSDLKDHLLAFIEVEKAFVLESGVKPETLRETLDRIVKGDPKFSPRRKVDLGTQKLPEEMAQHIRLERA